MVWISDLNNRMVNIDNWDYLEYELILDKENEEKCAAYKIFLGRGFSETYLLGYVGEYEGIGDEIIEHITKGIQPSFSSLNYTLIRYLEMHCSKEIDKFKKKFKGKESFDDLCNYTKSLIDTRFFEAEFLNMQDD